MQAQEGSTIGHYCIQRLLKRGGMSQVYLAYDTQEEREVAIKIADGKQSERTEDYQRLQREVVMLNTVQGEHILPVLAYGQEHHLYYLVTPYMRRGTLLDRLAQGPLTEAEVGAILAQLADALGNVHALGIIHRDIKPSNILSGEQSAVYLADFGAATATGGEPITREDILLGTPYYMAPELFDEPATILSDTYAIGVLLYQLLTGHLPFQGKNPLEICWKHANLPPPPLTQRNPALSSDIQQVVLCALEKNPRQRFQTVQEMEQAYREALTRSGTKPQKVLLPALPGEGELAVTPVAVATHPAVVAPLFKREFPATRVAIVSLVTLALLSVVSLSTGFQVTRNQPSARPASSTKVVAQPNNSSRPPLKKPASVTFQPPASAANSAPIRNEDNHGIKHNDGSANDGDNGNGKGDVHGSGKGGGGD